MSVPFRSVIVDDNATFLTAAKSRLEREGVEVAALVANAEEAVDRVREASPDVVLVDIALGDSSGFDLARQLAAEGARVVLISTREASDVEELVAESPAVGFVSKSELSARTVRELLDGRQP